MAKILKGYRGQSNPEDPIRDITKTYVGTPGGGGGGTDPEETEATAEALKMEKLIAKAEEKGWSDKKRIRRGIDENPKDYLPADKKAVFKKGEWVGTRDKWGGGKGEEGGKPKIGFPILKRDNPTPSAEVKEEEVKYKPIKVKTNKNPYKSKYLKGKGKHRRKVRTLKNFSGLRRG